MKKITVISFICIIIDQLIKIIVTNNLDLNTELIIIDNFFSLTNVQNDGAAFSILSGNRIFLICVSLCALILLYFLFVKDKKLKNIDKIIYGVLLGGIIGNLIDRVLYGYVIDYLSFNIFGYSFPIFNFADICIVLSMIGLIIWSCIGGKNG